MHTCEDKLGDSSLGKSKQADSILLVTGRYAISCTTNGLLLPPSVHPPTRPQLSDQNSSATSRIRRFIMICHSLIGMYLVACLASAQEQVHKAADLIQYRRSPCHHQHPNRRWGLVQLLDRSLYKCPSPLPDPDLLLLVLCASELFLGAFP